MNDYKRALYIFRFMFALRLSLSFALAWFIALFFNLHYPYWALMTVIIVSMPTQGEMLNKFFARLTGTVLGVIVVNIIANLGLSAPWAMILLLTLWLACCTYMAHSHKGLMTYLFSLSGYTSAILGFGLALAPNAYMVYYLSQARLAEILLGLVCSAFVAFLFPSKADHLQLQKLRHSYDTKLISLFRLLVLKHEDTDELNAEMSNLCKQVAQTGELNVNVKLADKFDIRAYFNVAKATGGPLDLLSKFFLLRELGQKVQVNDEQKQQLDVWHNEIDQRLFNVQAVDQSEANSPVLDRKNLPDSVLPTAPAFLQNTAEGQQYVKYLQQITHILFHYLKKHSFDSNVSFLPRIIYRDHTEALFGALRLVVSMFAAAIFWFNTQWDMGHILLVLTGLSFSLGVTYPEPDKGIYASIVVALIGIAIAFVYLFAIYIQTPSLGAAMIITMPLIFLSSYFKTQSLISFGFWHICMLTVIFLCSYENVMQFNLSRFVNTSMASLVSSIIAAIVLGLIPQSGTATKLARMQKRIKNVTNAKQSNISIEQYLAAQSLIFNTMGQVADFPDDSSRQAFLNFSATELKQLAHYQALSFKE